MTQLRQQTKSTIVCALVFCLVNLTATLLTPPLSPNSTFFNEAKLRSMVHFIDEEGTNARVGVPGTTKLKTYRFQRPFQDNNQALYLIATPRSSSSSSSSPSSSSSSSTTSFSTARGTSRQDSSTSHTTTTSNFTSFQDQRQAVSHGGADRGGTDDTHDGKLKVVNSRNFPANRVMKSVKFRFATLGDWGSPTRFTKSGLQKQIAEEYDPHTVLLLGDNFYSSGIKSIKDPRATRGFGSLFHTGNWTTAPETFYPVLGNHDYSGNTTAQTELDQLDRRWYFPSKYYSRLFIVSGVKLFLVALDTNRLLSGSESKYHTEVRPISDAVEYDVNNSAWNSTQLPSFNHRSKRVPFHSSMSGKELRSVASPSLNTTYASSNKETAVRMLETGNQNRTNTSARNSTSNSSSSSTSNHTRAMPSSVHQNGTKTSKPKLLTKYDDDQYEWLETQLASSVAQEADWLVVMGHHPVYSASKHGDSKLLIKRIKPLLEKYHVNMYLFGHDHVLQHLQENGVHYFGSGAASKKPSHVKATHKHLVAYSNSANGGMVHIVDKDTMEVKFVVHGDKGPTSNYTVTLTKESRVSKR